MAAYLEHRHLRAAEVPVERFFTHVAIARLMCVHALSSGRDGRWGGWRWRAA